jgi:enamine deaminase RidA (YjgF/YER057c/UK114 family)
MTGDLPRALQPAGWATPKGYANGMIAHGTLLVTGGQIGWDADCVFRIEDFPGQVGRALENVVAVLTAGGAGPEHVVRLTWYVTDLEAYRAGLRDLGPIYRRVMGRHFPAMSVVQVAGLVEPQALVEIEATAVIPD